MASIFDHTFSNLTRDSSRIFREATTDPGGIALSKDD